MSQASSNPSSYVYIPCPSHPDLFITNICKERECIEPLCPECITAHLEMHAKKGKTAKIENIQRVKKECLNFLQQVKAHIVKDLSDMKFADQQAYYQQQLDNLKNSHQRVADLLDDYFEILERELRQKIKDLD